MTFLLPSSDKGTEYTVVWRLALGNGRDRAYFVEVGILFPKFCKFQHHAPQPHPNPYPLTPKKTKDNGKRPISCQFGSAASSQNFGLACKHRCRNGGLLLCPIRILTQKSTKIGHK